MSGSSTSTYIEGGGEAPVLAEKGEGKHQYLQRGGVAPVLTERGGAPVLTERSYGGSLVRGRKRHILGWGGNINSSKLEGSSR